MLNLFGVACSLSAFIICWIAKDYLNASLMLVLLATGVINIKNGNYH